MNSSLLEDVLHLFTQSYVMSQFIFTDGYLLTEKQHVETNLKVTVAGISLMFCFQDESGDLQSGLKPCQEKIAYSYHYLALECADISLILKVKVSIIATVPASASCLHLFLYGFIYLR